MATTYDEQRPAAEDLPPLPRPWHGVAEPPRRGCGRPLFAGCGCLVVGFLGLLLLVQWQREAIMDWSVRVGQDSLLSLTDGNLNDAQRNRVDQAFATFRAAVGNGSVDFETATELNRRWNQVLRDADGSALEWQDILPLIEALEALETAPRQRGPTVTPSPERGRPGEVA